MCSRTSSTTMCRPLHRIFTHTRGRRWYVFYHTTLLLRGPRTQQSHVLYCCSLILLLLRPGHPQGRSRVPGSLGEAGHCTTCSDTSVVSPCCCCCCNFTTCCIHLQGGGCVPGSLGEAGQVLAHHQPCGQRVWRQAPHHTHHGAGASGSTRLSSARCGAARTAPVARSRSQSQHTPKQRVVKCFGADAAAEQFGQQPGTAHA
jgi:hypothetical protein